MELVLQRFTTYAGATLGLLTTDDAMRWFTVEDDDRLARGEAKIAAQTAIPAGKYKVTLTLSARFGRILPLLLDVPQFTGVRIHAGNTKNDTDGCILVCTTLHRDGWGGTSKPALEELMRALRAREAEGIWLDVRSELKKVAA